MEKNQSMSAVTVAAAHGADKKRLQFLGWIQTSALGMTDPEWKIFQTESFDLVTNVGDRVASQVVYRPATQS